MTSIIQGRLRTKRRSRLRVAAGFTALFTLLGVAAVGVFFDTLREIERSLPPLPDPTAVVTSPVVLDRSGLLLRPFTIADGRWRLPATTADVDKRFLDMLIAYEDKRFFEHDGIDWRAMARAAGQFLAARQIVSGASTLTMQVARLVDGGGSTRSIPGKLRQMAMARALERRFSKDEILTLYLQLAPYGGNLEGTRAASLAYFGKEPARLTVAEAALLVALPQAPGSRRPDQDPEAALAARNRVLDRMVGAKVIDAETAAAAKSERMPTARRSFPMYAAHLGRAAVDTFPDRKSHRLTIDRRLQGSLEMLAHQRISGLGPKVSAAIVVADHKTGEILASVGSAGLLEEARNGHVDMTRALRSPGSTLKPLIYGLAFEQGLAHPESLIEDRPTGFGGGYAPVNFDGHHRGTVTMREALVQSLNVPAVVVLDAVGPARLVARLKRAAATPVLPDLTAPGLAVGLGGVGISLRDLVSLYGAIARGGTPLVLTDGVEDKPAGRAGVSPVLEPIPAWYVADILADVPPPTNGSPDRVAYKTGTSYGYRDAWAIGFDGRHVVGVWVGRPDGTPVSGLSGATTAAPILFEAFDRIGPTRTALRQPPPGVMQVTTAQLPGPLRRFRHPDADIAHHDGDPEIAFPLDGVAVDLGIAAGDADALVIKVRNGAPPFTFFANGLPIARPPFSRTETWQPDGPGYATLSVVDATGRSDRVTVFLE